MSAIAPEPRLRPGVPADLNDLLALEQAAFTTDHLSRRSRRRFMGSPNAGLIVVEQDGKLSGYALVLFRPRSAIARLYMSSAASSVARLRIGGVPHNMRRMSVAGA